MFIFFVYFFSHPDLLLLLLDLMVLNEWEWMEVVCWRMKMNENEWNLVWEWTNKLNFNFLLLLSARERNAVFSNLPILSAFFEWHSREHEHLKRENENEMEKYLLLANQQWRQMNIFHNECCFQWDLECLFKSNQIKSNQIKSNQIKSNQIKSNQIILSNFTYPIWKWLHSWFPWIWVSEGRSKQSSKHNSHFISFQFNLHTFHD